MSIDKSELLEQELQCRGKLTDQCFTIRDISPPGSPASDVWINNFYPMRGLFVTVGGTAGPQRNQANVGSSDSRFPLPSSAQTRTQKIQ